MTRPIILPGRIGDLARAFPGGLQALADHLHVHRSTIGRWARKGGAEGPAKVLLDDLMAIHLPTPSTTRTK